MLFRTSQEPIHAYLKSVGISGEPVNIESPYTGEMKIELCGAEQRKSTISMTGELPILLFCSAVASGIK